MLDDKIEIFSSIDLEEYITTMGEFSSNGIWDGQILLISDDLHFLHSYEQVIEKIGGRCGEPLPLEFDPDELTKRLNTAAVILHVAGWSSASQSALHAIELFCQLSNIALLIRVDLDDLDNVLAQVKYSNVEHLLSDNAAELLISLQSRIKRSQSVLFADRDEIDFADLKRISADVERIARALVDLSGSENPVGERPKIESPFIEPPVEAKVSDAPVSFKPMQPSELKGFDAPDSSIQTATDLQRPASASQVRDLIKARRLRDQYFDAELFADPAWDMLLDLMAARLEGVKVSVSSLCIAASVPPTTALRWIKTMTDEKIFLRTADEKDGRRIFIELSDEATAGMIGFFSMIRRNKLMIV